MNAIPLIPRAFALALRQLGDGRILGILLVAVVATLLITGPFLLLFTMLFGLLDLILPDHITLPYFGEVGFLGLLTKGLVSKTGWLFWTYIMSPLILAIVGLLLEPIVEAVEARHYPHLPKVRRRSLAGNIGEALRFLALMIGISFAAWIIAALTPLPAGVVFILAAGYLIAREYFDAVALRRLDRGQAKHAAQVGQPGLWIVGCIVAVSLTIPFVNLITPLVGVAAFTHLFHWSQPKR